MNDHQKVEERPQMNDHERGAAPEEISPREALQMFQNYIPLWQDDARHFASLSDTEISYHMRKGNLPPDLIGEVLSSIHSMKVTAMSDALPWTEDQFNKRRDAIYMLAQLESEFETLRGRVSRLREEESRGRDTGDPTLQQSRRSTATPLAVKNHKLQEWLQMIDMMKGDMEDFAAEDDETFKTSINHHTVDNLAGTSQAIKLKINLASDATLWTPHDGDTEAGLTAAREKTVEALENLDSMVKDTYVRVLRLLKEKVGEKALRKSEVERAVREALRRREAEEAAKAAEAAEAAESEEMDREDVVGRMGRVFDAAFTPLGERQKLLPDRREAIKSLWLRG